HWVNPYSSIPNGKENKVVIYIVVNKKGEISSLDVENLSSDSLFNRAAISAIYAAAPFDPIPESVNLKEVKIKVEFETK
ncbi:MAG: TonB family protein, partial [Desulfurobacteriaceae bacterium]